ncbi:MAG: hypothetical protein ABFS43_03555 [Thermodesulfobacteriota bacterium]
MEVSITVAENYQPKLVGLLAPSFSVRVRVGIDLKTFICQELGVRADYFEERIQTVFLDSKPVDDVTTALVHDRSVLALSAAMPGLVGATFRKGGQYSWMRRIISHEGDDGRIEANDGWVTVKLFNMVLKELGPGFLERGIWIDGERVQDFIKSQPQGFRQYVQALPLDGTPLSTDGFLEQDLSNTSTFLNVRSFAE